MYIAEACLLSVRPSAVAEFFVSPVGQFTASLRQFGLTAADAAYFTALPACHRSSRCYGGEIWKSHHLTASVLTEIQAVRSFVLSGRSRLVRPTDSTHLRLHHSHKKVGSKKNKWQSEGIINLQPEMSAVGFRSVGRSVTNTLPSPLRTPSADWLIETVS